MSARTLRLLTVCAVAVLAVGAPAHAGKSKPKGKGTLVVRADVDKAVIYEGKKKLGTTPLTVKLKPGKHVLTVKKAGQLDAKLEVEVVGGQQVEAYAAVTTVEAFVTRPLRVRCDAGDLDGCHELGDALEEGRTRALGAELIEAACARGNDSACVHVVQMTWGKRDAASNATAEAQLRAACDAGDVAGCGYLGAAALFVEESKRSPRRGVELLQGACDGGYGVACYLLAAAYKDGQAGVTDTARAAELYARGCDLDQPASCLALADWTATGQVVAKDDAAATALYQRACDGDHDEACGELGIRYATGDGAPADEARARPLLARGCRAAYEDACAYYGKLLLAAKRSLTSDATPTTEMLRQSCERGGLDSCVLLGNHHYAKGDAASKAEARTWYARACDGGRADLCATVEALKP